MSSNPPLKKIDLSFDSDNSHDSARKIVYKLYPEWEDDGHELEFETFSEGITNTMYKITHAKTSLVFRSFGLSAEPLTSRPREIATHSLASSYDLSPTLLARFPNGLVYTFTPSKACSAPDLSQERIYRGVARTLGKWHAVLPLGVAGSRLAIGQVADDVPSEGQGSGVLGEEISKEVKDDDAPGDIWAVMRTWASRIPEQSEDAFAGSVKAQMIEEVEFAFNKLGTVEGLAGQKLVMGHCDLLAGNVLVRNYDRKDDVADVQLIDYEYSVACHPAFDIALHFGEWAGFECDYTRIPDIGVRRRFVEEYVRSWRRNCASQNSRTESETEMGDEEEDVRRMCDLVDQFRGLPGLWFGLWGLVQAEDSSEEFDYREYAKLRLGEYFVWKGMEAPLGLGEGKSDPRMRERRWFSQKEGE